MGTGSYVRGGMPRAVTAALRDYVSARRTRQNLHPNANARDMLTRDADEREMALLLASAILMNASSMVLGADVSAAVTRYSASTDPAVRLASAVLVADLAWERLGPDLGLR